MVLWAMEGGGDLFSDSEVKLIAFHALLVNIFNKCDKKVVFIKKTT